MEYRVIQINTIQNNASNAYTSSTPINITKYKLSSTFGIMLETIINKHTIPILSKLTLTILMKYKF